MDRKSLRRAIFVSSLSTISIPVSVLVQVSIAALCGVSSDLDGYIAASAVPLFVIALCGGSVPYVLIPALAKARADGDAAFRVLAAEMLQKGLLAFVGIAAIGYFGNSMLLSAVMPDLSGPTRAAADAYAAYTWAFVVPSCLIFILTAISQAAERFRGPSMASAVGLILNLLALWIFVPPMGVVGVAIAALVGAASATVMIGVLLRDLMRSADLRQWSAGRDAALSRALGLAVIRSSVARVVSLIDTRAVAGLSVGSLAYLTYSSRLVGLMNTALVSGFGVVLLPVMSQSFKVGKEDYYKRVGEGIQTILAIVVPVAVLCFVLRSPLVSVAFQRKEFSAADTAAVAALLGWQLLAMPGMAIGAIVGAAYYAKDDVRTLLSVSIADTIAYAVYLPWSVTRFGLTGVAMSWVLYWHLGLSVLVAKLWWESGGVTARSFIPMLKCCAVALAAGAAAAGASAAVSRPFVQCAIGTLIGAGVYLSVGAVVDAPLVKRALGHAKSQVLRATS